MSEILLQTQGLTRQFGGITALNHIDLKIPKNRISGVIGPNGAGKTTLFNNITGFDSPTQGKVYLDQRDITHLRADQINRLGLARTFQNIRLFKEMSALENVMLGRHHQRLSTQGFYRKVMNSLVDLLHEERAIRQHAWKWIHFMGLEPYAHHRAQDLPYGKQKELEIARALATEPQLLLLDEPAAGMNPAETRELMTVIRQIAQAGITIILIEHDMHLVMNICDTLTVLNYGETIATGTPAEIKSNPLVIKAYLGE